MGRQRPRGGIFMLAFGLALGACGEPAKEPATPAQQTEDAGPRPANAADLPTPDGRARTAPAASASAAASVTAEPSRPSRPTPYDAVVRSLSEQAGEVRKQAELVSRLRATLAPCSASSVGPFRAEVDRSARNLEAYELQSKALSDEARSGQDEAGGAKAAKGAEPHDPATWAVRARDLEARAGELGDQIRRNHTRLSLLSDTIGTGCPAP